MGSILGSPFQETIKTLGNVSEGEYGTQPACFNGIIAKGLGFRVDPKQAKVMKRLEMDWIEIAGLGWRGGLVPRGRAAK